MMGCVYDSSRKTFVRKVREIDVVVNRLISRLRKEASGKRYT